MSLETILADLPPAPWFFEEWHGHLRIEAADGTEVLMQPIDEHDRERQLREVRALVAFRNMVPDLQSYAAAAAAAERERCAKLAKRYGATDVAAAIRALE